MTVKWKNKNIPCLKKISSNLRSSILVFDSGVGGLSIYDKIRKIFPNLHYIYCFDNIAFPYGKKNVTFIIKRVIKIISAIQKRYPLALTIIACNTASTVSLTTLRKQFHFPIIGVVPAIKPAARLTTNGIIGLLATNNTIKSSYTRMLISLFANQHQVATLSSIELVEMAEAKLRNEIISLNRLKCILYPWISMPNPPDTIVLGCTHFSLLENELLQVFPKEIQLVDSREAIAKRASWILENKKLDATSSDSNIAFCITATKKTQKLLPALYHYGFKVLKELIL